LLYSGFLGNTTIAGKTLAQEEAKMPNFGPWEWAIVLVIVGGFGSLAVLLPWAIARFILSIKKYL